MREEEQLGARNSTVKLLRGSGWALDALQDSGSQAQGHALPGVIAGGHSGREKQEGRFQGWLQVGVQQAAAGSREQVRGYHPHCPLVGTGQGTSQDGKAQVPGSPSLTLAISQP